MQQQAKERIWRHGHALRRIRDDDKSRWYYQCEQCLKTYLRGPRTSCKVGATDTQSKGYVSREVPDQRKVGATDTQSKGYVSQEVPDQREEGYIAWSTIAFIAVAVLLGSALILLLFPYPTTIKVMAGSAMVVGTMFAYIWLWAILHHLLDLQNRHYMVTVLYTIASIIGGVFIVFIVVSVLLGAALIPLLSPYLTAIKIMIGAAIVGGIMFAYFRLWAILHAKLNMQDRHDIVTVPYTAAFIIGGISIPVFLLGLDLPFLREFKDFVIGIFIFVMLLLLLKWLAQKWEETGGW